MSLPGDTTTYSLVINSADKISGTNNNATYQINWRDFLPDNYDTYKLAFSFQSVAGYYSDGYFSNTGPNLGALGNTTTANQYPIGTVQIVMQAIAGAVLNCILVGPGIQGGTRVIDIVGNTVTLSLPTVNTIVANTPFYFYNIAAVNISGFSGARILMQNQGRSYSFDTQTRGPSINLGIIQRDIQIASSKSNSLSCFYSQNPPRTMARPNQNIITISIMNNYTFSGGIVGYTGAVPIYSAVATNQNFLTDTNSMGSVIATDMTAYTMLLEFTPIGGGPIDKRMNGL